MAQRIEVLLLDDLDGSEASQTVRFSLDGASYEIDLSDSNAERLRSSLAAFVAHGRKSSRTAHRDAPSARRGPSPRADPAHLQAVREWARGNGYSVSDRGRIPNTVLLAYNSAT
jgi:hypothetical protein